MLSLFVLKWRGGENFVCCIWREGKSSPRERLQLTGGDGEGKAAILMLVVSCCSRLFK